MPILRIEIDQRDREELILPISVKAVNSPSKFLSRFSRIDKPRYYFKNQWLQLDINKLTEKITPKSGTDKRCKLWSVQFTLALQ